MRRVARRADATGASSTRWTAAPCIRVAIIDRPRAPRGDDRLHRHQRAAADQFQRAVGGLQGRGAVRVPHAGRRRDPDECRLPEAADDRAFPKARCSRPRYPAAVVAGNVETSQAVTDALYGALGVLAASQGTMNNFTFGNASYQYYETICGGAGAGPGLRRRERRADAHDQLAADRPRGARVALPGAARQPSASAAAAGGAGPPPRRRRRDPRRVRFLEPMTAVMLANHRGRPVRRRRRRAGRAAAATGSSAPTAASRLGATCQVRDERRRRVRHPDAGRGWVRGEVTGCRRGRRGDTYARNTTPRT